LVIAAQANAKDTINGMLVFAEDSGLSQAEKIAIELLYEGYVNVALNSSGLSQRNFVLTIPYVTGPTGYYSKTKTHEQAVEWFQDEIADELSPLWVYRESYYSDIAFMVIDDWLGVPPDYLIPCGGTPGVGAENSIPTSISKSHDDDFSVAVIKNDSNCILADLVPHEFGHLLYAEHETSGSTDQNGSLNEPAIDNHGMVSPVGESIMKFIKTDESTAAYLFSGANPSITGPYSNVVRFINEDSWDTVSKYREPPPPPCDIVPEFNYCIGGTRVWSVTATLQGYSVLNADYDVQLGGAGPWIDIFEGPLSCPAVNLDVWAIVRAILLTEFGTSQCSITIPLQSCSTQAW
jgi:hypothetical protein